LGTMGILAGIFVGGQSRRMGGLPKGLLRLSSGETVVDRWRSLLEGVGVDSVLVGSVADYAPRVMLADAFPGTGPLGGLVSLLRHAELTGRARVLAVGCDMPHIPPALVMKLRDAPAAAAVAPRRDERWEPMLARYDVSRALPVATARATRRELSMQGLLDELSAAELALTANESFALDDWDTLTDVKRRPG